MFVEVCANSLESALNAEKGGASRIELCMELGLGGLTPTYGLLKTIKEHISIPVHILIRPRSGDFVYSDNELEIMLSDIKLCEEFGFAGIVSGILKTDFTINIKSTKLLIEASKEMNFTFHRAFDWVNNPVESFEVLEDLGVNYLLSSGQKKSAVAGIDFLSQLQSKSRNCIVMPGAGINSANVSEFATRNFEWVHLSGSEIREINLNRPELSMSYLPFLDESKRIVSSATTVSHIVNKVKL
ncbi:copper homeostasis protein CutC [Cellulophaga baltica]|uniref:copper homeostasis protein CutC n=1 Tax=Cellulophaga TaxID=104264 RepID=UPI001C06EBDF|nr:MULTISPECIES: copper homeostasis protein CutC [Cellulophaga]MBU2997214.1 copper homeostasis protein CutC [Cellulophaga baltica]MDO6768612.1 copper homeostasis protein CutC [Cellulophaga sp. 1_MG-2023]